MFTKLISTEPQISNLLKDLDESKAITPDSLRNLPLKTSITPTKSMSLIFQLFINNVKHESVADKRGEPILKDGDKIQINRNVL